MHWCMDETLALMAMIPFIGYFFRKLHVWYHSKLGHTCHEKHCDDTHAEHTNTIVTSNSDDECWDPISQDDVEERFLFLLDDLTSDLHLLKVSSRPVSNDFLWYVNQRGDLMAHFQNRIFVHDDSCCEHGWYELERQ